MGIIDGRPNYWGKALGGRLVAGSLEQLDDILHEYKTHGVDVSMIVHAETNAARNARYGRVEIEEACASRNLKFLSLPDALGLSEIVEAEEAASEASEEVSPYSLSGYWALKRAIDFTFAALMLLALLPLLLIVAALTWFDVGSPVFFWQQRIGMNGAPLYVYKFRTLRAPFDRAGNPVPEEKRLSTLGTALRRTRMDELPQLWNILNGEMSFIGPRPLMDIDHPEDDHLRTMVPPGVTGWAQIKGGRIINSEEKGALDDYYVRHASLWLDIQIAFLTAYFLLVGDHRDEAAIKKALDERTVFQQSDETKLEPAA